MVKLRCGPSPFQCGRASPVRACGRRLHFFSVDFVVCRVFLCGRVAASVAFARWGVDRRRFRNDGLLWGQPRGAP
uniref:Uncharacterized protein n=1 Tax=Picea sitchensis TaxID=3332 RepID=D5A9J8_PICSI|nr:unknown [Picea sitchensis]